MEREKTARSLWLLVCFKYLEFYFYLKETQVNASYIRIPGFIE